MNVKINWQEKTITFKSIYTRWIDKEFNSIIFKWVKANSSNNWVDLEVNNIQEANDFLVKAMTNLTDEEIQSLSISDYNKILEKIWEIKSPSK